MSAKIQKIAELSNVSRGTLDRVSYAKSRWYDVDLGVLKEKGIDVTTMIVITNSNDFKVQSALKKGSIVQAKTSVLLNCERK